MIDDDCEGLWRIHDDLYDLTNWEKNHPGLSQCVLFNSYFDNFRRKGLASSY